jgi:tight adherence protein B
MTLLIVILVLAGVGTLVGGFIMSRRSSTLLEERLGLSEVATTTADASVTRQSPVGDALNQALASRGLGANLATQLARADLKLTVGEFMAATAILVIAAGTLAYFWKGIIVSVVAALAGIFGPRIYVSALRNRRLKAFNDQLGDSINLLVNSLRAGYSVLQAMEAVAQEMGEPIASEFGRVVQEVQLGITLEEAMGHMLRRITSDDLDMMVTAINVQREVGGNLAEVLDAISYTIRERVRIKGEIKALSAQSRWSGYIVSLIPVILTGVLYLINPGFMSQLFNHICGWVMIGVAIIGITLGYVIINKIVTIDI